MDSAIDVPDRFGIVRVIEIVIAVVIQPLDQVNITTASTGQVVPRSLCMYMHRSTLVTIQINEHLYDEIVSNSPSCPLGVTYEFPCTGTNAKSQHAVRGH